MAPRSVLITGCNRGIGLELVKQWVKVANPPEHLIATCRKPDEAKELKQIADSNPAVKVIAFDVNNFDQYDNVAKQVESIVGKDNGLNLLINNAGVLSNEVKLDEIKVDTMVESFKVNCLGALFFTRALLPLLQKAADAKPSEGRNINRAAIIQMSTAMASIDDNSGGGHYPYRCSKVALNMAMKSLSVDLKDSGILVLAMHPGWVRTDMGGPNALIDTEECSTTMIKTLEQAGDGEHGGFLRYNNTRIAW